MATTRNPGACALCCGEVTRSAVPDCIEFVFGRWLDRFFFADAGFRGAEFASRIGIEQLRKSRILCQVLEVRIVSRLKTKLRIQTQSFVQVPERFFDASGQALERGQPVDYVIC